MFTKLKRDSLLIFFIFISQISLEYLRQKDVKNFIAPCLEFECYSGKVVHICWIDQQAAFFLHFSEEKTF